MSKANDAGVVRAADLVHVLRGLPDVLTVIALTGEIEYVSEAAEHVLGAPVDQFVGHRVCEFLDADGQHNCLAWVAYARHGVDLPELTHNVIRPNKTLARLETRIRLATTTGGIPKLIAVSRDVSARAAAERRAADRSRTWAEVIDLIHEGVIVVDEDGSIVAANRSACELISADPAAVGGVPIHRLVVAADEGSGQPCVLTATASWTGRSRTVSLTPRRRRGDVPLRGRATRVALPSAGGPRPRLVLVVERATHTAASGARAAIGDRLTPRERSVLRLLAEGRDLRSIADELGLSIHTVRAYVKSILHKLDVRTQLQAVIVSARSGLLDLS